MITDADAERFESFLPWENGVVQPDSRGCWRWQGEILWTGFGVISGLGLAHRVSYSIYVGRIPIDSHVLQTCNNPACVNPAHLVLGLRKPPKEKRRARIR